MRIMKWDPQSYALIGYQVENTVSDHGGVTRGICSIENSKLKDISETRNIVGTATGWSSCCVSIKNDTLVSMNFCGYLVAFMKVLRKRFPEFYSISSNSEKDEYLLPNIADRMLREGTEFTVLHTDDHWFGLTYQVDRASVKESFRKARADRVYEADLFSEI